MKKYISSAIYAHTPETEHLVERLREHASKATITPILDAPADAERFSIRGAGGDRKSAQR